MNEDILLQLTTREADLLLDLNHQLLKTNYLTLEQRDVLSKLNQLIVQSYK